MVFDADKLRGSWRGRLHFGRDMLLTFLPMAAILAVLFGIADHNIRKEAWSVIESGESMRVAAARNQITHDFGTIVSDLFMLARSDTVARYLDDRNQPNRAAVERLFLVFADEKGLYDQVRLLDAAGWEAVRVDYRGGNPAAVAPAALQDKSGRYYFSDAIGLPRGGVYVSPFDLNIEHGEIARPFKPMIRFATPVFDRTGARAGVLVLNYFGTVLLDHMVNGMSGTRGQGMLLNAQGYWLHGPVEADEWAFMFGRERSFATVYPALWEAIAGQESGQIRGEAGLITFSTVRPVLETLRASHRDGAPALVAGSPSQSAPEVWTLATLVPRATLDAALGHALRQNHAVYAIAGVATLLLAAAVAAMRRRERRSQEQMRLSARVVEVTMDGVAIMDQRRVIFSMNSAFTALTGYGLADVRDLAAMALPSGHHDEAFFQRLWQTVDAADHWSGEIWFRRRDGSALPTAATISAIRDRHGRIANYLLIILDISDRKIADQARFAAEAANHAKSLFLATMSHELRTPLNAILGFAELIRERTFGPAAVEKYSEYAGDIHSSGVHLLDLINDILDVSKIEAGKLELAPTWLDLPQVLTAALRLVRDRANQRGLAVMLEVSEPPPRLCADERAVKQILFNLLSNAIKFTPEGGRITVRVRTVNADTTELAVTDTGIGIPQDQIDRVLQPFEQVDNRYGRTAGGTGLGLSLVKALAELHRGRIRIDSIVDRGTTVTVRLPNAGTPAC